MSYPDLEVGLSKKSRAVQKAAREFGMNVVRPAGIELDKMHDPADAIAEGSRFWEVHRKFRETGFHKMMISNAFGGTMQSSPPMGWTLVSEQLGYADAGLAISLVVSCMPFAMAVMSPTAEVRNWAQEFVEDKDARMVGCWGITEPDHGSDWVLGTTPAGNDPKSAPSLRAVKKGDEYILNGRKSAWVSNGTIATHSVLHVGLDTSKGMHGQGLAFCRLDLPGISRGKPLDKIGQRALNQGEIIFEDVKLHKKYMFISTPGLMGEDFIGRSFLGVANSETAVIMSGLAQAALDEAVAFAKTRVQGGAPIIERQNIKLKLFDMFAATMAAQAYTRKVADYNRGRLSGGLASMFMSSRAIFWMLSNGLQVFLKLYEKFSRSPRIRAIADKAGRSPKAKDAMKWGMQGIAAKVLATETAFKVSNEALQIFGGEGLSMDCVVQKLFRDARASMIEDGTNEALALAGAVDL